MWCEESKKMEYDMKSSEIISLDHDSVIDGERTVGKLTLAHKVQNHAIVRSEPKHNR